MMLKKLMYLPIFTTFATLASLLPTTPPIQVEPSSHYEQPVGIATPLIAPITTPSKKKTGFDLNDFILFKEQLTEALNQDKIDALESMQDLMQEQFELLIKNTKLSGQEKQEITHLYQLLMLTAPLRTPLTELTIELFIIYLSKLGQLEKRAKMKALVFTMRTRLNQLALKLTHNILEIQTNILSFTQALTKSFVPALTQTWSEWIRGTTGQWVIAGSTMGAAGLALSIVIAVHAQQIGKFFGDPINRLIKQVEERFLKKGPSELIEEFIKNGRITDAVYQLYQSQTIIAQKEQKHLKAQIEGAEYAQQAILQNQKTLLGELDKQLETLTHELDLLMQAKIKKERELSAEAHKPKPPEKKAADEHEDLIVRLQVELGKKHQELSKKKEEIKLFQSKITGAKEYLERYEHQKKKISSPAQDDSPDAYLNALKTDWAELKRPTVERLIMMLSRLILSRLKDEEMQKKALQAMQLYAGDVSKKFGELSARGVQGYTEALKQLPSNKTAVSPKSSPILSTFEAQ